MPVPANFTPDEVRELLNRQGYTRFLEGNAAPGTAAADAKAGSPARPRGKRGRAARSPSAALVTLQVVQDRLRAGGAERGRVLESLEAALRVGRGRVNVHAVDEAEPPRQLATWRYSSELHCAGLRPLLPRPRRRALFSFNSPLGACETCRGFGRTIGIDYGLVIPDETQDAARRGDQALADASPTRSARRTWRSSRNGAAFRSTRRGASSRPRRARWVIEGEGPWTKKVWYGVRRFFAWLETRAYKMHVRVLLSRYRAYTPCDGLRRRAPEDRGAAVARRQRRR